MAGESAQHQYERQRDRRLRSLRENRVRIAVVSMVMVTAAAVGCALIGMPVWIGVVAAVAMIGVLIGPSTSEQAWGRGAEGERVVAAALDRLDGALVLHDRNMPGSRANIDHLVVTGSGVYTIDAKHYRGRLAVGRGSIRVAGRDRSKLLEQAGGQADVVRTLLAAEGLGHMAVRPALCFVGTEMPLLQARQVGGVIITTPRRLERDLGGGTALDAKTRAYVHTVLSDALEPAHAVKTSAEEPASPSDRGGGWTCPCGAQMVRRTRRSDGAGFLGCSTFPRCRQTRPLPS